METPGDKPPMGPLIAKNFARLGYADFVVRSSEIAKLATAKGHKMSRQRVAAILNAVRVTDETLQALADAVGVTPADLLLTEPPKPKPKRTPKPKPPASPPAPRPRRPGGKGPKG